MLRRTPAGRRAGLLFGAFLLHSAVAAVAQDYDSFSDWEMENYQHFQRNIIGRDPSPIDFQRGYKFILPLYLQFPQSHAYRICLAQATSGFPASSVNAPLHVRGIELLLDFQAAEFAESGFMGILLMNMMERLSEDRDLLTPAALTDSVRLAFLRADAVAAGIFATTLRAGTWHKTAPGSNDWTIRAGMVERRARLAALPPAAKSALPDWEAMERTAWLPEAALALAVLGPVLLEPGSYRRDEEPGSERRRP